VEPSPRHAPETRPTPLQPYYIQLSVVALVCGFVAITAFEAGVPLGAPVIRIPALVGGVLLGLTMADALVRIWRAAWAWMPLDRGRGLFRLVWVVAVAGLYALLIVIVWVVVTA
jgi:hypothetical protein